MCVGFNTLVFLKLTSVKKEIMDGQVLVILDFICSVLKDETQNINKSSHAWKRILYMF